MRNVLCWAAIVGVVACIGVLAYATPAAAVQTEKGFVDARIRFGDEVKRRQVMVSLILDGAIISQDENDGYHGFSNVKPGTYEVRWEAEGLTTVVKRGIVVTAANTVNVTAELLAGAGVHVVQYTPTAMTRDELAGRLLKLEAMVVELKKR